ncbi:AraC-like ligand-binding domain-containing protein, partial [Streptomyces capparidis]
MTYSPARARRTARLIRQHDPETYHLWLNLSGTPSLEQDGRQVILGDAEIVLHDSSRPFHGEVIGATPLTGIAVCFPRTQLPLPPDLLDRLTATRLPARTGMGALLARYLTELTQHAAHYHPDDTARLATATTHLLTAWCAHHLDAGAALPPEAHHQALTTRIHHFIEQHLGDPRLGPATIAAAHGISVRHLYTLFNAQGLTVAARIRQRRLEHC